ncbi:MAG: sigma-54-dependent Fis family transcriptional regulator [Deltaproteobacteria bacterium]|nr:sigma-54-dependent Fis family transcriptional regulator [Deltaproteobacteria bacterium]
MISSGKRVLIVDDEPSIRKVLAAHLRKLGHEVETAEDGEGAVSALEAAPFHLVVTDLKMPGMDGMEVLAWVRRNLPELPVILITAHGTVDNAVEALKLGAFDYITKPFEQDELYGTIGKALATQARNAAHLSGGGRDPLPIVGTTEAMQEVYHLIARVAPSPTTVLITGESGTGKELVARALHERSDRAGGPFIQINCGAIPEHLFEAELFGFERGAFTGAVRSKPGRFELAHGGTLFLDEVVELPKDMQVKLLRVLQERKIERVGGLRSVDVDVRILAATNCDLLQAVREGRFREDLYYRLHVIPIHLPPLRERVQDIPLLVEHFRERFNTRLGKAVLPLSEEVLEHLKSHRWSGNIRELENLMERLVLLADGPLVDLGDLRGLGPGATHPTADDHGDLGLKEYVRIHTARLERTRIERALEAEDGNVTRAARRLGISRKSLQTKMKDYGLREVSKG